MFNASPCITTTCFTIAYLQLVARSMQLTNKHNNSDNENGVFPPGRLLVLFMEKYEISRGQLLAVH